MALKSVFFCYITERLDNKEVFYMLIEVFLFLVVAGVLPIAIKGKRLSFVYLFLLTISIASLLGYFYQNWQMGTKDNLNIKTETAKFGKHRALVLR